VEPPLAPEAIDDVASTPYQTPVTVDAPGVLSNDAGTGIAVQSHGQPAHGTVTLAADGSFTYTPDDGFAGDDSFDYVIVDEVGQTADATVTITVALPGGPVAVDDDRTTPYETVLTVAAPGILGNDTGTAIAVTAHTDPGHGTVTVGDDGSITYTPEDGFVGVDSFAYDITDRFDRKSSATVRITVDPPPAPVAADDAYETPYETPRTVGGPGVLGNDSGTGISVALNGSPAHGTVTVAADGSLTYTPDAGFAGIDTFTYGIVDEVGQVAGATVTVMVDPPAAPAAADDAYATPYETPLVLGAPGIVGNDSGTGISVATHGSPAHGTVTVAADGSMTYTPDAGFAGDDSFTYGIADEVGQEASATVTVTVARPGAPVAADDADSTAYETPLTIAAPGILGNDSGTTIEVGSHTEPAHGTLTVDPDGGYTYTPDHRFHGTDSFDYTIVDPWGRTATATVTITVGAPGAPVAVDDTYETPFETAHVVAVPGILDNDSGTAISVADHTAPAHGTVAVGSDGSMTYTPDAGFAGVDTFDYTIADEVDQQATATVTITVVPPAGPEASDDAYATPFETELVVDAPGILGNDSGTAISVALHDDPGHGTVAVTDDGAITYEPDAGFSGVDEFTYGIVDQLGRTAAATVTVTVAPPGAPVAVDDAYSTPYQTALEVPGPGIVANDSGTGLTVTSHTDPAHGTVDVGDDGTLSYTPAKGFTGTDTLDYVVTDRAGQTATATVTIVVAPPGGPVARADAGRTPFETRLVVDVPGALGNDSGTAIAVTDHTAPGHGSLDLAVDGAWVYTPDQGFSGSDSVIYTIVDEVGQTAQATITITVDPAVEVPTTTTTTTAAPREPTRTSAEVADPPPAEGTIVRTGSDVTRWVLPSITMVIAGGILLLMGRRQRRRA
jgi:VCBS repeat-containing protein